MGRKSRDSRRTRVAAEAGHTPSAPDSGRALVAMALAWAIPGAGHLWLGRRQKGVVFLLALPVMFALGLWLEGALAPFDPTQPLVFLAGFAALVSLVFAVLLKDEPAEQVRLGGLLFGAFVGTGVVLGWILFPFPL